MTERADIQSITITWVCLLIGSSAQAANASVPPRRAKERMSRHRGPPDRTPAADVGRRDGRGFPGRRGRHACMAFRGHHVDQVCRMAGRRDSSRASGTYRRFGWRDSMGRILSVRYSRCSPDRRVAAIPTRTTSGFGARAGGAGPGRDAGGHRLPGLRGPAARSPARQDARTAAVRRGIRRLVGPSLVADDVYQHVDGQPAGRYPATTSRVRGVHAAPGGRPPARRRCWDRISASSSSSMGTAASRCILWLK